MNKPDDVSQEAWDAAQVAAKEATRDAMRDPLMPYYITVAPHIARAIQAARLQEREECAKIAQEHADLEWNWSGEVANLIRNRK